VVEPNIKILPVALKGQCELVSSATADTSAAIKVLLVDHREFKQQAISSLGPTYAIIDTRGVL
jgi:UDP-N-acetyl-D-mannosaminuronate dehydrogenase